MTPDVNDLLGALRAALNPPPPSAAEGWFTLAQLAEDLKLHEASVRRRLRALGPQVERQQCKGFTYYRLRNGKQ